MRANRLMDKANDDLRNGFRQIVRSPGSTAVAVLTLALGIGANTALFSIFNSLILRPLPVRDPASLALLTEGHAHGNQAEGQRLEPDGHGRA